MCLVEGLTEAEAQARKDRGQANVANDASTRSYAEIARANIFNPFNAVLITIGLLLISLGRANDALVSIGPLFLANAGIRTAQQVYAKRRLDRISILNRPSATVVRDGRDRAIDPGEIVVGDIVSLQAGDQVVADGNVVQGSRLEVDEALLTGESDLVPKRPGDTVFSGSICVAGRGCYRVEKVGAENFASRLAASARKFESKTTPLQRDIDAAMRVVILVVALISLIILVAAVIEGLPFVRLVQISAVLTASVPYGLFFITTLAYAIGAVTIARQGAIVQEASAVESLSSIDVLCMDKTGTLTANKLRCVGVWPSDVLGRADIEWLLGRFAVSASSMNRTSEALAARFAGEPETPVDEAPFTSARGWSALAFGNPANRAGLYVLGAMETLAPFFSPQSGGAEADLIARVRGLSDEGLRVLVFAFNPEAMTAHAEAGQPHLPGLTPLALVAFADELRPGAREAIAEFGRLGVQIKIISGDDPHTVAALARQAGLGDLLSASGAELELMSEAEFGEASAVVTVFGRVGPRQKERLVRTLMDRGRRVAMVGDGVNDLLAVKKAHLGIAMQSGSSATRNVADMVLLNDSFSALVPAFQEGKRIIAGVTYATCLYLTRVAVAGLVIVAISILGLGFPFEPAHVALSYLTAGIPSFFLLMWARPDLDQENLLWSLVRFVIPAAILTTLFGVALYTFFYMRVISGMQTYAVSADVLERFKEFTGPIYGADRELAIRAATVVAQTVLSIFLTLAAFVLILFLAPPCRLFTGWTKMTWDRRPAWLAIGLFLALLPMVVVPALSRYFALFPVGVGASAAIAVSLVLWVFTLRLVWRARLFERLLALE